MSEATDLWKRYCQYLYLNASLGFSLDISRMRFGDDFLPGLTPALDKALESMQALEEGAIANVDEHRMVGHYWLRNPDLAPSAEIASEIKKTVVDVADFAKGVLGGQIQGAKGPLENAIFIGIGGSALGPQFLAHALGSHEGYLRPFFLDNTDPDGVDRTLQRIGNALDRTLVVVTSKSGGTPEPRNSMVEVQKAFERAGVPFGPQAVAVTQAGSHLDQQAVSEGWRARFPMWDWVGGRTSVMSVVGLLPAALLGIDVEEFLHGAREMDAATREKDPLKNPACLLAAMWYYAGGGKGAKDMVILPYKDRLELFSRYLQQLVMESLGKELNRAGETVHQGIAVYGNKGTTDQHAYVQQLRDGVPNFFATFIEVLRDRSGVSPDVEPGITAGDYLSGLRQGTRSALYEKGRDSITITIDAVDPFRVGALIALYERAVGIYGELVNVNAYHQPGVEAGKKAAAGVLALQTRLVKMLQSTPVPMNAKEAADVLRSPDEIETVAKILQHLAANSRNIVATGDPHPAKTRYRHQK